jgi:hypothetical protein
VNSITEERLSSRSGQRRQHPAASIQQVADRHEGFAAALGAATVLPTLSVELARGETKPGRPGGRGTLRRAARTDTLVVRSA